MRVCKFCGEKVEKTLEKCPYCGSVALENICDNCGKRFEGLFCPDCGVKINQERKVCPNCKTLYYSNACPNCGYTTVRNQNDIQDVENRITINVQSIRKGNHKFEHSTIIKGGSVLLFILLLVIGGVYFLDQPHNNISEKNSSVSATILPVDTSTNTPESYPLSFQVSDIKIVSKDSNPEQTEGFIPSETSKPDNMGDSEQVMVSSSSDTEVGLLSNNTVTPVETETIVDNTSRNSLFSYSLKGNGSAVITGFNWKVNGEQDIYIPRMIDGYLVSEIGSYAFSLNGDFSYEYSDKLIGYEVAVIIPDTVTKIAEKAFYYTRILSVNLPSSIKVIEEGAFAGCRNILQFTVAGDNETFATIDGVLYNKKDKKLVAFPTNINRYFEAYKNDSNIFYIPDGVISIAPYAFYDVNRCSSIIAIPSSVTDIGENAFEYSSLSILPASDINRYLSTVQKYCVIKLPDSVESIGSYSFAKMVGNEWNRIYVDLEKTSIKEIPSFAFYQCKIEKLLLPDSLEIIGSNSFALSDSGTSDLHIPENVSIIGSYAFSNIKFIVDFGRNSSLLNIEDHAFYESSISNAEMFILPDSLIEIGDEAFYNSSSVGFTKLKIPISVNKIGSNICNRTKVVLSVQEDSYAYSWAEENGFAIDNDNFSLTDWLD